MSRIAATKFVSILLATSATLSGCGYSLPVIFSDLSHDPGHIGPDGSYTETVRRIKESLQKEMTPDSTIQDGRKWCSRHGIPVESVDWFRGEQIIHGHMPYEQGLGGGTTIDVWLEYDEHGKYLRGDAKWDASFL